MINQYVNVCPYTQTRLWLYQLKAEKMQRHKMTAYQHHQMKLSMNAGFCLLLAISLLISPFLKTTKNMRALLPTSSPSNVSILLTNWEVKLDWGNPGNPSAFILLIPCPCLLREKLMQCIQHAQILTASLNLCHMGSITVCSASHKNTDTF